MTSAFLLSGHIYFNFSSTAFLDQFHNHCYNSGCSNRQYPTSQAFHLFSSKTPLQRRVLLQTMSSCLSIGAIADNVFMLQCRCSCKQHPEIGKLQNMFFFSNLYTRRCRIHSTKEESLSNHCTACSYFHGLY
jgi:hypothetical protein